MTRITELPFVTGFGATNTTTSFIVVDDQLKITRRLTFDTDLLPALQSSFFGTGQSLTPTSDARFASVASFLGSFTNVQIRQNLEIGGLVSYDFADGDILLTNENPPKNTTFLIRGYTNNYISTGAAHPVVLGELAGANDEFPTPALSGNNLLTVASGGYTGRSWTDSRGKFSGRLTFYATENWNDTVSSSTNVGTGFYIATHPNGIILDRYQDFQKIHLKQDWDAEGNYPVASILLGSGLSGYKNYIKSNSTVITHEGATKLKFVNTRFSIDGVVPEDLVGADNQTLLSSNVITIIGNRRSATSGRRNALLINDTIGKIEFRGMSANTASITNTGTISGEIKFVALEGYSSTGTGAKLVITTVNSGTTTVSNRLVLSNRENIYSSNKHTFTDSQGNTIGVISTGTDTSFISSRIGLSTSTISIVEGDTATTVISGFKTYVLSKVTTNYAARVRIYSDQTSQSADLTRPVGTTVTNNVNLITEVVTTSGSLSKVIAPGVIGFNSDPIISNIIYITLTNNTSTVTPITATITVLKLEL